MKSTVYLNDETVPPDYSSSQIMRSSVIVNYEPGPNHLMMFMKIISLLLNNISLCMNTRHIEGKVYTVKMKWMNTTCMRVMENTLMIVSFHLN